MTNQISKLLKSIPTIMSFECNLNGSKKKVLSGIIEAYSYVLENPQEIDQKYHFFVNRLVRGINLGTQLPNCCSFRDLELDYLTFGDAIDHNLIEPLMERLFYQVSKEEVKLSPLEKSALMSFGNFVIQPSGDGNKRTGLILGNKILMDYGLSPVYFEKTNSFEKVLKSLWENMYAWEPFLEGREVYNKEIYSPLVDLIKTSQ